MPTSRLSIPISEAVSLQINIVIETASVPTLVWSADEPYFNR